MHQDPFIKRLLEDQYGIQASLTELPGYQDINYLISTDAGERYILKVTTCATDLEFIRSQNRVLQSLSALPEGLRIPRPIPGIGGESIHEVGPDHRKMYLRLFPFLEGGFLAERKPELPFFRELGIFMARLDQSMNGLEDPVLVGRTHEWDLSGVLELSDDLPLVADPVDRRLVHYFLMKYREEVVPVKHRLPRGLIHADGNDWNILVSEDDRQVAGLIDFGDMLYAPRIFEAAILLAYAMMGRDDFREIYRAFMTGYREILPVSAMEEDILYYLVAARWCQTIIMAARQERENPGSAYHQVSVSGARRMIHRWIGVNPQSLVTRSEPVTGSSGQEVRYGYFSKALSLSYREPIRMNGAAMQYMYGADGITYLDCVNNIPHVGHCHPRVVEAGQRQMARLNTNTRYLYDSLDRYAEKLLSKFPKSLNKLFLVNSGSAATDLAVRLAEAYTGGNEYLVLDYAYHGNTRSAIQLSPYKFNRKGGAGKPDNVSILPTPRPGIDDLLPEPGDLKPRTIFFAESIVGCAGQVMLSREFMQRAVGAVRKTGGLYIADEVQTGFGRVGDHFWAYELYDVVPDMVLLGKPMGNGHPMGAVVCTEEVAKSFETGMEFFSSFGGNPVSCEIGLAVLEVIEEENLQGNAKKTGGYLLDELRRMQGSGRIKDVRGSGLFIGIELEDPSTGLPATEAAIHLVNSLKSRGILLSTDGPFNQVIKFKPPMCFSMNNAEELLYHLIQNL